MCKKEFRTKGQNAKKVSIQQHTWEVAVGKILSSKDHDIEKEFHVLPVMELSRTYKQYIKLSDNCQYFILIFLNFKTIFSFFLIDIRRDYVYTNICR